jgi:hypothetical protein
MIINEGTITATIEFNKGVSNINFLYAIREEV